MAPGGMGTQTSRRGLADDRAEPGGLSRNGPGLASSAGAYVTSEDGQRLQESSREQILAPIANQPG